MYAKLRDSGQSFRNRSATLVEAVAQKQAHQCRRNCYTELGSAEQRLQLFKSFRLLGYAEQTSYMLGLRQVSEPKRVILRHNDRVRERSKSFGWSINGTNVCKQAVVDIFGVTKGRLNVLSVHRGVPGPVTCNSKKPLWYETAVNDHIKMFKAEKSHYSRKKNPHRLYIRSDDVTSIRSMWVLFVDLHSGSNDELAKVSYEYYRNLFVTKHNLSFGKPASGTCTLCDTHEAAKTTYSKHYVRHKAFKKMARAAFDVDADAWNQSSTPKTEYLNWVVGMFF